MIFLGSITCAAYPLAQIDTIDLETGHISKISALNLVVFGVRINFFFIICPFLISIFIG